MPFDKNDKETAVSIARKGGLASGRWKGKDPATKRTVQIRLSVSQDELNMIDEAATAAGLSRVETIVQAVRAYHPQKRPD